MGLKTLYQKVHDFEAALPLPLKEKSSCQKGCARCCFVDLSIFSVEADHIREWFSGLTVEQKRTLQEKWSSSPEEALDFSNQLQRACAFLHEGTCTIYDARPLICRTQGLPMSVRQENESYFDVCPLNEDMLTKASGKNFLKLDLLNLILVSLEKRHSPMGSFRVPLTKLRAELWTQSVKL